MGRRRVRSRTDIRARAIANAAPTTSSGLIPAGWATAAATVLVLGSPGVPPGVVPVEPVVVVLVVRIRLTMLAEQITSAPPPLADPLHWLTRTDSADDLLPVAVQVSWTRVPPFAEPLHWLIVAPDVVAGKGSQPVCLPPPEPTH